ncbi:hypothetical protein ATL45_2495 [Saccharopolyspora antimicrobica]|uniref:Acyl-CoA carboxylase epsilon subunit n=1 Tax=Saccharopolyspora antimicrobica TaxID=455193 RepID=A0ABX9TAY3_9PSEU|nr:hypothetical protein ATL45_2495 [Saccharopolyspora antimicrobica]
MAGPEHFRAAEERLKAAEDAPGPEEARAHREAAQVHALLAQAAAIALRGTGEGGRIGAQEDRQEWKDTVSLKQEKRGGSAVYR